MAPLHSVDYLDKDVSLPSVPIALPSPHIDVHLEWEATSPLISNRRKLSHDNPTLLLLPFPPQRTSDREPYIVEDPSLSGAPTL